jgi:hypothetical protein
MAVLKNINDWEILTPSGWSNFVVVKKLSDKNILKISFESGNFVECTENHLFKLSCGEFLESCHLHPGDEIVSKNGTEIVTTVEDSEKIEDVYDLVDVDLDNEYFANDLVVHNCAFIDKAEEIWTSVQSAMTHGGGNAIILSTPNGMGNFFHSKWVEAEQGLQDINTIRLHWTLHPEYDQSWRDEQDKLLGPRMAAQECDCSFISSGNSVVDAEILKWYEENQIKEPISKEYVDRGYWKWTQPNYSNNYIVSADCGRGDGEDYSAFHVIDIENLEQVAEYKGKIETEQFGNFLVQVATEWNDALLIIENANIGWAVIQQVINREYKNLFYMTEDLRYVDIDAPKSNKLNAQEKKRTAGFTTSVKTRPLIISKLELCFREKSVTINSLRTISELYTFIWHNGKAQAANGYNDDLTMSLAIGLWVYDTALMLRNQNIELQKMSLGKMGKIKLGHEAVYLPSRRGSYNNQDPYKMKMRNGMTEDLRWLIK